MRVAFIGDIVGKPGRDMIGKHLPKLREEHGLDLVIANYENASHGFGLTRKNCDELLGIKKHQELSLEEQTRYDFYSLLQPKVESSTEMEMVMIFQSN